MRRLCRHSCWPMPRENGLAMEFSHIVIYMFKASSTATSGTTATSCCLSRSQESTKVSNGTHGSIACLQHIPRKCYTAFSLRDKGTYCNFSCTVPCKSTILLLIPMLHLFPRRNQNEDATKQKGLSAYNWTFTSFTKESRGNDHYLMKDSVQLLRGALLLSHNVTWTQASIATCVAARATRPIPDVPRALALSMMLL